MADGGGRRVERGWEESGEESGSQMRDRGAQQQWPVLLAAAEAAEAGRI